MKKTRIFACYNVFDGTELLKASILALKKVTELEPNIQIDIGIIYQTVSNRNVKIDAFDQANLDHLVNETDLVDYYKFYSPNLTLSAHVNEASKRNIGFNHAKQNKYDYYLSLDCDEFYKAEEFIQATKLVVEKDLDLTYCYIQDYLNKPIYQCAKLQVYYVPFLANTRTSMRMNCVRNYLCDPTRTYSRVKTEELLDSDLIQMHHMTGIRIDPLKKYNNSSSDLSEQQIKQFLSNIELATETNDEIRVVPNYFNIDI